MGYLNVCGCAIVGNSAGYLEIVYCPLHAAAPELLEATIFALSRCEENGFPNGDLANKARAAIHKATEGITL